MSVDPVASISRRRMRALWISVLALVAVAGPVLLARLHRPEPASAPVVRVWPDVAGEDRERTWFPAPADVDHGPEPAAVNDTAPADLESPYERYKQSGHHQQTDTRYIRLGSDGLPLADDSAQASCALSVGTGLVWEAKTFDGGLGDAEHTFTWVPADGTPSAVAEFRDGGNCLYSVCDTAGYVEEFNRRGLCGWHDWRLPTLKDLDTLLDRAWYDPVIHQDVFVHTRSGNYLTATEIEKSPGMVMSIDFFNGFSYAMRKDLPQFVRLVRGPLALPEPER